MKKILKFSLYLILIFCSTLILPSCDSKSEINNNHQKAMINDVNYTSLTEAVKNAKSGDTIEIRNDIKDNKNVVITKPVTLKGISSSNQTKPKFYGSLTIDLDGNEDSVTIENLEIIHDGTNKNGLNNDTTVGINLIDGGLILKSNIIGLSSLENADNSASGLVISRSSNSENTMPIIIKGNNFETYLANENSSAVIIKRNKDGEFQNITVNESNLFDENSFSLHDISNQLISIDYSTDPLSYSYFATSSINEFVNAIENHQNKINSLFKLFAQKEQELITLPETPLTALNTTSLYIHGNAPLNFNGLVLNIEGNLEIETETDNLTINKTSNTASIIKKEE